MSCYRKLFIKKYCVVCGTNKDLTRHHVIPNFISRILNAEDRDTLPICRKCHDIFETEFSKRKGNLLKHNFLNETSNLIFEFKRIRRKIKHEKIKNKIGDAIHSLCKFRDLLENYVLTAKLTEDICLRYFYETMKPKFDDGIIKNRLKRLVKGDN